jgi:hypothetical protein
MDNHKRRLATLEQARHHTDARRIRRLSVEALDAELSALHAAGLFERVECLLRLTTDAQLTALAGDERPFARLSDDELAALVAASRTPQP